MFDVQAAIDEALVDGSATAGSSGTTLVQSGQTFQTHATADEINVGDIIVNLTTGAVGTIVSIDSETQLTTSALTGRRRRRQHLGGGRPLQDQHDRGRLRGRQAALHAHRPNHARRGRQLHDHRDGDRQRRRARHHEHAHLGPGRPAHRRVRRRHEASHRARPGQHHRTTHHRVNTQSGGAIVASLTVDNPTESFFSDPGHWWNRMEGLDEAKENFHRFFDNLRANFGENSEGWQRILDPVHRARRRGEISAALAGYAADREAWKEA